MPMPDEVEALADCLRVVVDETVSVHPEEIRDGMRLAMALFVRTDLGDADPFVRELIARVFSVPREAL